MEELNQILGYMFWKVFADWNLKLLSKFLKELRIFSVFFGFNHMTSIVPESLYKSDDFSFQHLLVEWNMYIEHDRQPDVFKIQPRRKMLDIPNKMFISHFILLE